MKQTYKRFLGGLVIFLVMILGIALGNDFYFYDMEHTRDPSHFSSYVDSGFYKIDPLTILTSLDQGETKVFMPLPENSNPVEPLDNINLSWTQADYIQIAEALSKLVWNEPLDLNEWGIYQMIFTRDCRSTGFDYGELTYFSTSDLDGRKMYLTRRIEIDPYFSKVRWGGGATYPQPILYKWNSVNLVGINITADEALRIAESNGGKETRFKAENKCRIYLRMPTNQTINDDRWDVRYVGSNLFEILINSQTGEYEFQSKIR